MQFQDKTNCQREAGAISTACFHLEGELENSDAGGMMPLLNHLR
jgi:hypothetical protein